MTDKKPKGIGGWLILPTIGLFVSAVIWIFVFLIYGVLRVVEPMGISILATFLIAPVLAFMAIYGIVLEFRKKTLFPKWAIITLWAGVAATFILSVLDEDFSGIFTTVLGAIVWTAYFSYSKRVKNTFIN